MDVKYWQGGLERHEIDAIEKIKNVLSGAPKKNKKGKNEQGFEAGRDREHYLIKFNC